MIDDIHEPVTVTFDNLSVLEMQEEDIMNESELSSRFGRSEQSGATIRSPKLSIETSVTMAEVSKFKVSNSMVRAEFDYNSYIREELERLNVSDMDLQTRKKLIQKIRNRMSAQRSRIRNKIAMNKLQEENQYLRLQNAEILQKLNSFKEENSFLREQMKSIRPLDEFYNNIDKEEVRDPLNPPIKRRSRPETISLYKNVLVIFAVVLAVALSPNGSPEGIKLGGIVPLLATEIGKSVRQMQNMEDICRDYCLRPHCSGEEKADAINKQVRLLNNIARELHSHPGSPIHDKIVPTICYDEKSENSPHIFLFKESSLNMLRKKDELLYVSELTIVKPDYWIHK